MNNIKKKTLLFPILFIALGSVSWATPWTGNLEGEISGLAGGIYGMLSWSDLTFSWNVARSGSIWTYVYTFSDPYSKQLKELSNLIIQVSDDFAEADIYDGTNEPYELGEYSEANGNPGIPEPIPGIKWDEGWAATGDGSVISYTITLVSDRPPMAGNFYAKGGKEGGYPVYAWSGTSTGFGYNIPVPDPPAVTPVGHAPEPMTLTLYGFGFASAGLYTYLRRRKKKKGTLLTKLSNSVV